MASSDSETPMKLCLTAIEKKVRNLEKRKVCSVIKLLDCSCMVDSFSCQRYSYIGLVSHLGISPRMAFQGNASGRPRAKQN